MPSLWQRRLLRASNAVLSTGPLAPSADFGKASPLRIHMPMMDWERNREKRGIMSYSPRVLSKTKDKKEKAKRTVGQSWAWDSKNLVNPATLEELGTHLENKDIISDWLRFVGDEKSNERIGMAWKGRYLLYEPPGTDRSSLIVAMAKYLKFDIYNVDLTCFSRIEDLMTMLFTTRSHSLIAIQDFDNSDRGAGMLSDFKNKLTITSLLDDRYCGYQQMVVVTTKNRDRYGAALLSPLYTGRHIYPSLSKPIALHDEDDETKEEGERVKGDLELLQAKPDEESGELGLTEATEEEEEKPEADLGMEVEEGEGEGNLNEEPWQEAGEEEHQELEVEEVNQEIAAEEHGLSNSSSKEFTDLEKATLRKEEEERIEESILKEEEQEKAEEEIEIQNSSIVQLDSSEQKPSTDFDFPANIAHLVRSHQGGPIVFKLDNKDTREGLNGECSTKSVLSLDDSTKRSSLPIFVATENKAHLVRAYQSGPVVSLSENGNTGEALRRGCITRSILDLEDLQQGCGGRHDDAAKSFGAIYDLGFHMPDSLARKSFAALEALPTEEQSIEGYVQQNKSPNLPRVMQVNGVEQRVTKMPRYLGGLTAQYASSSHWPISLPDGGHIELLDPWCQSTKNADVARADQCSPTVSLPEKKMARKTLKRNCRTMNVIIFEENHQHFGRRWEGAAKSLGATCILKKHGINQSSVVKQIHKLRGIQQWPFRQKWAAKKGFSLVDERPFEVSRLSMDEKLDSRLQLIHMSQFARSSPRALALPDGGKILGPSALSSEFAATNNRARLVGQDQSGSTASHYQRKYTRETSHKQGLTMSLCIAEDLKQHFVRKHKDAVKSLGVSVSMFKRTCRQHWGYFWPCRLENNEQQAFDASNIRAISLEDLRLNFVARAAAKGLCDSLVWKSFEVLESLPLGEESNKFKHLAQRRALTHKHCVRIKKSQDLPRSLRRYCPRGLAAQFAISLPDEGHILSLSVGRRREDAAKFLGVKRICRQLVIHHESTAKRIRRQHGTRRWPFLQNWAAMKGYSLRDEILVEVVSLSAYGKLVSRLQCILICWLGRFSLKPSASPVGGEILGSIALSSSGFAATNRALRVGQDQNGSAASHSEKKRTREQDRKRISTSISLDELEQCRGLKRKDAAESLGVSESTFKRSCRQHGIELWSRYTRKKVRRPPDKRGENSTSPTRETLVTYGQIAMENDPTTSQHIPTIPHPVESSNDWRNSFASQEEPFQEGHVFRSINWSVASYYDPALSLSMPAFAPNMGNSDDWENLLASQEDSLIGGHVSQSINWVNVSCHDPAPSLSMLATPHTMESSYDLTNLLASLPDPFLEGQLQPQGEVDVIPAPIPFEGKTPSADLSSSRYGIGDFSPHILPPGMVPSGDYSLPVHNKGNADGESTSWGVEAASTEEVAGGAEVEIVIPGDQGGIAQVVEEEKTVPAEEEVAALVVGTAEVADAGTIIVTGEGQIVERVVEESKADDSAKAAAERGVEEQTTEAGVIAMETDEGVSVGVIIDAAASASNFLGVPEVSDNPEEEIGTHYENLRGFVLPAFQTPLLRAIWDAHPETFANFNPHSPRFGELLLTHMFDFVRQLQKLSILEFNEHERESFFKTVRDLKTNGIDLSWMVSQVEEAYQAYLNLTAWGGVKMACIDVERAEAELKRAQARLQAVIAEAKQRDTEHPFTVSGDARVFRTF